MTGASGWSSLIMEAMARTPRHVLLDYPSLAVWRLAYRRL
jgi:hypothetical protein